MITHQKAANKSEKYPKAPLKPPSPKNTITQKFQKNGTLRRRLLVSVLPAIVLPLVIASAIGYGITESKAREEVIEELESDITTDTLLTSKTTSAFIRDSFDFLDLVGNNPQVVQSIKTSSQEVEQQQLTAQPINVLEQKFADTKVLIEDGALNNYFKRIIQSDRVAEIFVTEDHGLNVAISNLTSDFIQSDEDWWKTTKKEGKTVAKHEFDHSANAHVISLSRAITDPQTGKFIGVVRASIPVGTLNTDISSYVDGEYEQDYQFQIIDPTNNFVLTNIDQQSTSGEAQRLSAADTEEIKVVGGESIAKVIQTLMQVEQNSLSLAQARESVVKQLGVSEISIGKEKIFSQDSIVASFNYQNKIYSLSTIPNTELISMGIVNAEVTETAGKSLIIVFASTAVILGLVSVGLISLLAKQLSQPLTNLSRKTQQAAAGNLAVRARMEGTLETRTLADNFNQLIDRVQNLLQEQQQIAQQQRQAKEQLEAEIYALINDVSNATEGDLTVRASLESLELSTVADLFNAVIDNLQEIAIETQQSTKQVGLSLRQNEAAIRFLSGQATSEAKETRNTLNSIEKMSQSIQEVAKNAREAENIADDTYNTVLNSSSYMDLTVDSIVELRTTVSETAKKMKRLGESTQKISQVVSFIEEIALKTNVLAINASVEARRAGKYGQGFTIVAEQVGTLAEQSAAATKKIAGIVAAIQGEATEVSQAMETGTAKVVDSTHLVESTKESLQVILEKSSKINQLMSCIGSSTVSQTKTFRNVTNLMQRIAQLSEATSISSQKVAQSIVETAEISKNLESAVAKFKVDE